MAYESYQLAKTRNKNKWYNFIYRNEEKVQTGNPHPFGGEGSIHKFTTDKLIKIIEIQEIKR